MSTDQGGLQSSVDQIEFSLRLEVQSLHQVFLGLFPVPQLSLNQGHVVKNLWETTSDCMIHRCRPQTTTVFDKNQIEPGDFTQKSVVMSENSVNTS